MPHPKSDSEILQGGAQLTIIIMDDYDLNQGHRSPSIMEGSGFNSLNIYRYQSVYKQRKDHLNDSFIPLYGARDQTLKDVYILLYMLYMSQHINIYPVEAQVITRDTFHLVNKSSQCKIPIVIMGVWR